MFKYKQNDMFFETRDGRLYPPQLSGIMNEEYRINNSVLYFLYAVATNGKKYEYEKYPYNVAPYGQKHSNCGSFLDGVEITMQHGFDTTIFVLSYDGVFMSPYVEKIQRSFGQQLKLKEICNYEYLHSILTTPKELIITGV